MYAFLFQPAVVLVSGSLNKLICGTGSSTAAVYPVYSECFLRLLWPLFERALFSRNALVLTELARENDSDSESDGDTNPGVRARGRDVIHALASALDDEMDDWMSVGMQGSDDADSEATASALMKFVGKVTVVDVTLRDPNMGCQHYLFFNMMLFHTLRSRLSASREKVWQ